MERFPLFATGFAGKAISNPPPETMATYCRGLAVDPSGNIYIAATGTRSVLKITPAGKVSTILEATAPWSPTGVTIFRGEVYVLEYSDAPPSKTEDRRSWIPRVRKIGVDGKVTILATISR
jgi:DNA-binding beta-propeller fold protein YncE